MRLEHSFTVPVGIDEAWRVLIDIGAVAPCMPGSKIADASTEHAAGTLKVKLGPPNLNYKGSARLAESDESVHRAVIAAEGTDARNGSATATVVASLAADGVTTTVALVTDLEVTGKPAQFAHGVMADVGAKVVGQFSDKLAVAIGTGEPATATPKAPGPAEVAKATKATGPAKVAKATGPTKAAKAAAPAKAAESKPRPKPRKASAAVPPAEGPAVEEPAAVAGPIAEEPSAVAEPVAAPEPETAPAPAMAAVRSFATTSTSASPPSVGAVASVNGHGSPTPPARRGGLAELARPAMVRGVAPAAIAVLIVAGVLRRRRRR